MINKLNKSERKRITHTYTSGKASNVLVIPKNLAKECGMNGPVNVVVEKSGDDGILIRKIEVYVNTKNKVKK